MKKLFVILLVIGMTGLFVGGFAGSKAFGETSQTVTVIPSISVVPSPIPIEKSVKVIISGAGFPANKEVEVRLNMEDTSKSKRRTIFIINSVLKNPVTADDGTFSVPFELGKWLRGKPHRFYKPAPNEVYFIIVKVDNFRVYAPLIFK